LRDSASVASRIRFPTGTTVASPFRAKRRHSAVDQVRALRDVGVELTERSKISV